MTFKEMFLAEHPIDGEQMLEEARIKAAKGSALFDALETHMKSELLTKLRDEVEGLGGIAYFDSAYPDVRLCSVKQVLALLEKEMNGGA